MKPRCNYCGCYISDCCCNSWAEYYQEVPTVSDYEKLSRKITDQWVKGLISDREFALKMYEISISHPDK